MDNRNISSTSGRTNGRRTAGGQHTAPAHTARRRTDYNPDTMDRYNYVDRDIYSSSNGHHNHNRKPLKKKHHTAKRALCTLLVLAILLVGGGFVYFHVMASRLNRSGNVDSKTLAGYAQQPADAPAWAVKYDGKVMNILLLGIDENDDGSDGRSDSNMLISIDSKSKTMRLVSFLRDSYLQIPTIGKRKLNAAYANGGVALTMQTLENNYRVNIDKYISVNFNNFSSIIDKMGGLDVPMSAAACQQENENIGTSFKKGTNHLNGKQCLYYARIRNAADDFGHDDYGRAGRQRQVIQLMLQKMKSMNPIESSKIMYDYLPYVKTNLGDMELAYLASVGATFSSYKIESKQIPAPNTFDDQKYVPGIGDVIDIDLTKNCAILRQFLYGDVSDTASSAQPNGN